MNTNPPLPESVTAALINHLLEPFQNEAEVKKSIGEKTKFLLWVVSDHCHVKDFCSRKHKVSRPVNGH